MRYRHFYPVMAALLLSSTVLSAAQPLPAFKAPLKSVAGSGKEYTGDITFDPGTRTFNYGSKKVVFNPDGTFGVNSGIYEIGKFILVITTPRGKYQRNSIISTGLGTWMKIKNISTTEDSILFEGTIPWNKAREPEDRRPWTISARIQDGKKLCVEVEYERPDYVKATPSTAGIQLQTGSQVVEFSAGEKGKWIPGQLPKPWVEAKQFAPVRVCCRTPEESFTISSDWWRPWKSSLNETLRINFADTNTTKMRIIIDLEKSFEDTGAQNAFSVMKGLDDLTVPARGKNLMPNPYFAVPGRFHTISFHTNAPEGEFYVRNAKFGRYSFRGKGTNKCSASVPLDPGDYVYSFYAKGNGRVIVGVRSVGNLLAFKKLMRVDVRSPKKWTRYERTFRLPTPTAVQTFFTMTSDTLQIDGIQLEKGTKATAFEAPKVEAGETKEFFFPSGKDVTLGFELSTLEPKVSGKGTMTVKNFFGEEIARQTFDYSVSAGTYPKIQFKLGKIPDGIYVVKLDYGKTAPEQFYRMGVMPFLKNKHLIARAFSPGYGGFMPLQKKANESYLARLQAIGIGIVGHGWAMTPETLQTYQKYGVQPFDLGFTTKADYNRLVRMLPEYKDKVPVDGRWFVVGGRIPDANGKRPRLPSYTLVGGWNESYRQKLIKFVAAQVRLLPKYKAYYFGSEAAHEVKDDPYYPQAFAAYKEAIKSVYPDAWVYEGGEPGMNAGSPGTGVDYTDGLLARLIGKAKSDLVNAHTYTKDVNRIYTNFRALVKMMKKHPEYADSKISLAEGMHFYPYHIAPWKTQHICWNHEGWSGNAPSYDMGWHEKLAAAYTARAWLIFLTEFQRLWCATSSAENTNNIALDMKLSPRAFQKVPNTLGVLLGNPKRWIGDFTFAPQTKCLVWEDEQGRPLAAVWNEDPKVDSGYKDAPLATLDYPDAEYIDLMGVKREAPKDGKFALSSFPLFIRGRAGDFDNFTRALASAVLDDPDRLPCHISFEIVSADQVKLTLTNQVARELAGNMTVFDRKYEFVIPPTSSHSILVQLPSPIRKDRCKPIRLPYVCDIQGRKFSQQIELNCFLVPKFKGSWKGSPSIPMTNRILKTRVSGTDLSASYQMAWDEKNLYLRVAVKDDVFAPGTQPGYRFTDDILQVFIDSRCSAVKTGRKSFDEDDYEFGFMPTADGKKCEVWRARSPDIQLTMGTSAPPDNAPAPEIPAKFTRTADGYIYEAVFPATYILPMKLQKGYNFAVGLYAADRDKGKTVDKAVSNSTQEGKGCADRPHTWPIAILAE